MAVYTKLGAETMAAIIAQFNVGTLVSAKGIAEGVSNSNWLIEAQRAEEKPVRYILTVYESRVETGDLPFFLGLLDHLAERGCPVPRTIHDSDNHAYRMHEGKALALIEFLPGVSVDEPTAGQAHAVGAALAQIHIAAADFAQTRENSLALPGWKVLLDACGAEGLTSIHPELAMIVARELKSLAAQWPTDLPRGVIHADLFPDNVLMLGESVTGLIDFYFACTDVRAYDYAITHAAWCFSANGAVHYPERAAALAAGYAETHGLSAAEIADLPMLGQGAALRFTLTRAYDWLNTPADALVTRKDPMAFARRMDWYARATPAQVLGG